MAPDAPDIPGYTLRQIVGRGGRSVVYEADDDATGDVVAVKVLTPRAAAEARTVRLLREELKAGLAVRHDHIVRVLGGNGFTRPYFLVMELLSGESLRQRLIRDGQLDPPTAVAVARQMASALAALHKAGYLHADVKPENIRLPGPGLAKLVDLGFVHRPGDHREIHAAGHVMGTANYLAPEMCDTRPQDGFPVDVFALGVTLFEALTGVLPYRSGSVAEVVWRHREEWPDDLRTYGEWPRGLPEVVARMLAYDPGERPSARGLVRELMGLQIGMLKRTA